MSVALSKMTSEMTLGTKRTGPDMRGRIKSSAVRE